MTGEPAHGGRLGVPGDQGAQVTVLAVVIGVVLVLGVAALLGALDRSSVAARGRGANPFAVAVGSPAEGPPLTHEIQLGETLSAIAQRHGLDHEQLARANPAVRPSRLRPGDRLVLPDPGAVQPLTPAAAVEQAPSLARLLAFEASLHGLDPTLVQAVAWQESRWNQRVVSHAGAVGVMQVLPATAATVVDRVGPVDVYDPVDNVAAGVAYLAVLVELHAGDVPAALVAYHQGLGTVAEHGVYHVSTEYVTDVQRWQTEFAALAG